MQAEGKHGFRAALVGGLLVPLARLGEVLHHAVTVVVKVAEFRHGIPTALIDRLLVPLARLGVVLRHTLTVGVKDAEANHGIDAALVGGLLVPLARIGEVLGRITTEIVMVALVFHGACVLRRDWRARSQHSHHNRDHPQNNRTASNYAPWRGAAYRDPLGLFTRHLPYQRRRWWSLRTQWSGWRLLCLFRCLAPSSGLALDSCFDLPILFLDLVGR